MLSFSHRYVVLGIMPENEKCLEVKTNSVKNKLEIFEVKKRDMALSGVQKRKFRIFLI